jgi:hypothetical protein
MVVIGRLCASTHDAVMKECVAPVSNNTSAIWESTGNIPRQHLYRSPRRGHQSYGNPDCKTKIDLEP